MDESEKCENLKVGNEKVGELCLNLQKTLKSALDLEFCLVQNKMIFLQCRPVTQKIILEESGSQGQNADDEQGDVVSGLGVSAGEFEGKPIYLEDYDDGDKFEAGEILLVDYTDPEWVPIMLKCRAIVSAEGGILSHTAIIARELKIPCITSVGYKNLEKLSKCNKIKIDANKGKITILE